jgi:polysaccharide deacetylase family protein (PEP-CTERM system associated)
MSNAFHTSASLSASAGPVLGDDAPATVLSFDVEEHHRIEAAAGLCLDQSLVATYGTRLGPSTHYLLERLEEYGIKATFFVVGDIAQTNPGLVREIHRAGHEVASHGWDHKRVHRFTPASFCEDLRRSKGALEQVIGEPVVGYRAPTFSIVRQTAWAIDVLGESGLLYDSSIYPVRHDRYGIHDAPRAPFLAQGRTHTILEFPPLTLRLLRMNVPVGGGGYFRLLPLWIMRHALRQSLHDCHPRVAMIYFHPWEFDPDQPRLPLRPLSRFRTYIGMTKSRNRLESLLSQHTFSRAVDLVAQLKQKPLPQFSVFRAADRSDSSQCLSDTTQPIATKESLA